jgi:uncharacterized membrane protein
MNKMLVAMFDTEKAADAGLHALRKLHAEGDISLYATGVITKDSHGIVSVKEAAERGALGASVGLAVGALIGLLAGPVGVVVGAAAGTTLGALRDFWVAGVGLDFVEEAEKRLQPGKVALLAEIDEEWVTPVDSALESAGGVVFRRNRSDIVDAQYERDVGAFKSEIKALEAEAGRATGAANAKLHAQLTATQKRLDVAVAGAKERVGVLEHEASKKAAALKTQLSEATGDAKAKIEQRMKAMKAGYHERGAKLSEAWGLTKEALTV